MNPYHTNTALLVVGLQTDLLPGGAMEVPGSDKLISSVNQLMEWYEHVLAAKFSLPADHLLFAANHPWRKPGQLVKIGSVDVPLEIMFCVKGSFGEEFTPGLHSDRFEFVAEMGAEPDAIPHSAFFDTGNPRSTGLKEYLIQNQITELHLCGVPLETTLWNTARDALNMNMTVKVIAEASLCREEEKCPEVLEWLGARGILHKPPK
ncbi:MAG: nicotinamidase [Saprospiraceae bacterium]|nr:MAG: nicotinamidase [Saprospiraceae bacterium]